MTSTNQSELAELQTQIANFKSGIREIAHEINNPLGVLRMAAYLMEMTNPDEEKRKHYVNLINTSVDKIEIGLKRLKTLRENPSISAADASLQQPTKQP